MPNSREHLHARVAVPNWREPFDVRVTVPKGV